jgi:hypothetical protein
VTKAIAPRLVEIEPGRFRIQKPATPPARSALPRPHVISDIMEPTEQVDGRFYTSKAAFRAVGRAHGLTEVGNEKPKPKQRSTADKTVKEARRQSLRKAAERYRAGERPAR